MKLRSISNEIARTHAGADTKSRLSRDQQVALKAMAAPDDERERYVLDLKRRVNEYSYTVTSDEIAEAILAERIADNAGF